MVIHLAAQAERVLLDASPFFRFGEVGMKALIGLGKYLGNRAGVTLEVEHELERTAKRYPFLANLPGTGWPPPPPFELPPYRREELLDIKRADPDSRADQHLGEISTVLMAQELGDALTIIDDELGKKLCRFRHVPRISTATLAAEMTAAGACPDDLGFAVFDGASPDRAGRKAFDRALREVREALS